MFFYLYFSFPRQYHSTNVPYSFIHLPPTLYDVSLPVLQVSPVSIIPKMLHTHSFIYHRHYMMSFSQYFCYPPVSIIPPMLHTHSLNYHRRYMKLFSQYFSFSCQYHSTNAPHSFIYIPPTLYDVFLPLLQFSLVSIIPPMLHTHSLIYYRRCMMFFFQYFRFPPFSIIPPTPHTH